MPLEVVLEDRNLPFLGCLANLQKHPETPVRLRSGQEGALEDI